MHHIPRLVRWPLLAGVVAAVSLVACSSDDTAGMEMETEVAGVVLDRGTEGEPDEDPDDDGPVVEDAVPTPDDDLEGPPDEDVVERPTDLSLLRSGPTSIGTVWLSAAGQWVGLDGQSLDASEVPSPAHLHAIVDVEAGRAQFEGCELRLVAPDDAELEVVGEFTVEMVVAHTADDQTRIALDVFDLDVTLAPGGERTVAVAGTTTVDLDVDHDRRVHCEGRFDRT